MLYLVNYETSAKQTFATKHLSQKQGSIYENAAN